MGPPHSDVVSLSGSEYVGLWVGVVFVFLFCKEAVNSNGDKCA